jgi:transposase
VPRCIPTDTTMITLGVDTHKDIHVGVALDGLGRFQGTLSVPTNLAGYKKLVGWANEFGSLKYAGVEGTGSFGAGLTRFLKAQGIKVFEVVRPKRRDQYRAGKSDPIDAEAAARAVLAGTATGEPKGADGKVEMIRTLRVTRRSAVKARAGAVNQLKDLLLTAPEGLKSELLRPLHGQTGRQGISVSAGRESRGRRIVYQVCSALGGTSLPAALRRDLRAR